MPVFSYGTAETDYLSSVDPKLGTLIVRYGHIEREIFPDLFTGLVNSIAGQQISGKALQTIWARLCGLLGDITPAAVLTAEESEIRACGLSGRKINYMRAAAKAFRNGDIQPGELRRQDAETVIRALTSLPGVGRWTAEMLLIFSLERPDVLAYDDFGIRKGLCILYGLPEISREQFSIYRKRYSPYATVAGFYLWRAAAEG